MANIVVWPDLFEKRRRVVLSAGMMAIAGRVQCEGEVVHLIARTLADLSPLLRSVGERDQAWTPGRADRVKQGGNPRLSETLGRKPPNANIQDVRRRSGIKLCTRDFR